MVGIAENLCTSDGSDWSSPADPVSAWSYKQLENFFRPGISRDTSRKGGGSMDVVPNEESGSRFNCGSFIQYPDLCWDATSAGVAQRMRILENRSLICAHLLAPWTQEESLLESFLIHLNVLCKSEVLGSPEISQLGNRFPGLSGRVLYFSLTLKSHTEYQPKDILLSFSDSLLSNKLLSSLIVRETLKESASELMKGRKLTPLLKLQFVLMDKVPAVFCVQNSIQEYYDNGLTCGTRDFPEIWLNTYQPLFYHLSQIIIYWAQASGLTESRTVCVKEQDVGFSLFSLLNMTLCSFLRAQSSMKTNYPLSTLLIEFFAFLASFKTHDIAICLANHEQNYICKRSSASSTICSADIPAQITPNINDPTRIQILSPIDWRHDLTSHITVSRNFIQACRSSCKSLLSYVTNGIINSSCNLLKIILATNDCIQGRKSDVAACNKILNSI